mgnify:CR=1 FL=1
MKSITRRALLTILAGFSFFNPAAVLSAKEKELAIFYSFSGNSKRVTEIFQKLEHCDISEIKTLEPYNAYDAREDRKKRELPPISPLNIDLDNYRKIVLIFPVWGYTPALPMQSFLRKHSLNNEVELETMLRNRSLPPSMHAILTKGLDAYKEEIKARIDFTNAEFAKMLPRTATWCKTPQVKPKPRLSTNPAPDCLSFQNNILYFNGQPIGMGVFYGALPSEGSEVTISGSTNTV